MKVCVLKKKYFFVFDCVNVRAVLKRKFPDFFLDNLLAFYLLTNVMTLARNAHRQQPDRSEIFIFRGFYRNGVYQTLKDLEEKV